jgi:hypothetical protein
MAKDSYKDGMLSIMIALRAWAKFLPYRYGRTPQ